MSVCWICKSKPPCASIARGSDGNLYLHIAAHSAVGNTIPLCYEVVPSPQEEVWMPHQEGAICDACIRGYGGVGMLKLVGDDDASIERLRQRLANEGPLKPGEVDAALKEAREILMKYGDYPEIVSHAEDGMVVHVDNATEVQVSTDKGKK